MEQTSCSIGYQFVHSGWKCEISFCACLNSANLCILGGNVKVIVCAGS